MSRRSLPLPAGYEMLVHGSGPRDVAIQTGAKVELMKASKEQRASMSGAVTEYAGGGFAQLPARMRRIEEAWFPSAQAREKVRVISLTPVDTCAYGYNCALRGQPTLFITGIQLCDASDSGAAGGAWEKAGAEALIIADWVRKNGGSHDAV